jgi:glutathione S-transferase
MATHKLVTIRFSHYNEVARWAMDHHGLAYSESHWLPGLSALGVALAGGFGGRADRVSTRWSTPLLVTAAGERVHDSRDIVAWADAHGRSPALLRPGTDALAARFHDQLGPHTRRVSYAHLLPDTRLLLELAERNSGRVQAAVFRAGLPLFRSWLGGLGLSPERVAKSRGYIRREFDWVGDALERNGSDYLAHGTFTAGDLYFAAMASPCLFPQPWEGFGGWLPPVEQLPDDLRDFVAELRAHPAGAHAMRMFRHHRGNRRLPGKPRIDQAPPHDIEGGPDERPGGGRLGPGVVCAPPRGDGPAGAQPPLVRDQSHLPRS